MQRPHIALCKMLDAHWVLHAAWPHPDPSLAPHVTPLYYARLQTGNLCAQPNPPAPLLIFVSDPHSEHGTRQQKIAQIGASIALESTDIAKLRGATLRGQVRHQSQLSPAWIARAQADYLLRHPQAKPHLQSRRADLYLLALSWAKLTDNEQGIGTHPIASYDGDLWEQLKHPPEPASSP